jgi:uncharacterized membrane protein YkoI
MTSVSDGRIYRSSCSSAGQCRGHVASVGLCLRVCPRRCEADVQVKGLTTLIGPDLVGPAGETPYFIVAFMTAHRDFIWHGYGEGVPANGVGTRITTEHLEVQMSALRTRRHWLMAMLLSMGLLGGGAATAGAALAGSAPQAAFQAAQATPGAASTPTAANCEDEDAGEEDEQRGQADTDDVQEDGDDDAAEGDTDEENGEDEDAEEQETEHAQPGTLTEGQDLLPQAKISVEQAVQAAQAKVQGDLGTVELEQRDGMLVFEVTIGDQEVFVNASDGTIVSVSPVQNQEGDCEEEDAAEANATPGTLVEGQELQSQATITLEQAIQIAQGAAQGELGTVELEDHGGRLVYEVEIGSGDVIIDADTGEVLSVDQEDQED